MSRIYGYARVSSKDQNLDRQLLELEKYVDREFIFADKQSGKDMDRLEYQLLRKITQKDDTIYIKSLDRLGRNKQQIKQELEYYKNKGVRVKILDLPTTMMSLESGQEWLMEMINNLLLEVLSTMAQQERTTIKQRQKEGIAAAQLKGKHLGRPKAEYPPQWESVYKKWQAKEITAVKAMELLGLTRCTFYNLAKKYKDK